MYAEELIKIISKKAEIDISKLDIKELVMGMEVELEHGSVNPETNLTDDSPEETFKIVMAHMKESPNYYTKLKEMEVGKKEKITEYAKRMRELSGLSEGIKSKSLRTIQEGNSSFDGGATFYAKDMTGVVGGNFATPEFYEDEKSEAIRYLNNTSGFVTVLYDQNNNDLVIYKDVTGLDQERDEIDQEEINSYMELSTEEVMEILNNGNVRVYTKEPLNVGDKIYESNKESDEFETHTFEQKEIEGNVGDDELYTLNENTIIILDFLDEENK